MCVRSRVRVSNSYSEEFAVTVGVHQGSVISPLLFRLVIEDLSMEFCTSCPWELLYALWPGYHHWHIIRAFCETQEMEGWYGEELRVNMNKIKVMVSGLDFHTLKDAGKYPAQFAALELVILLSGIAVVYIGCIGNAVTSEESLQLHVILNVRGVMVLLHLLITSRSENSW